MPKLADFVLGELTNAITDAATTIRVTHASPYNRFPDPDGETARAVISDSLRAPTMFEIVTYTGITEVDEDTTDLTGVTRGADGTTAEAFDAGAPIRQDVTAANMAILALQDQTVYAYGCSSDTTVRKINPDGTFAWTFAGHNTPVVGLAVDFEGNVYSAEQGGDSSAPAIKKIDPDGNEVWSVDPTTEHDIVGSATPNIMAFGEDGYLYYGTTAADRSGYKIDPSDGSQVWRFEPGSASQANVVGIMANRDGIVCQAQTHGDFYLLYPDGSELRQPSVSSGNAGDAERGGIKVTPDGAFLLCGGVGNHYIEKVYPDGTVEELFDSGSSPGYEFIASAVHPVSGDIYVVSNAQPTTGDMTIRRFDSEGTEITGDDWPVVIENTEINEIEVGLDGFLYAAGLDPSVVYKVDAETGEIDYETEFFAFVRRVAITRLTTDMVARYEDGAPAFGFVNYEHVADKPASQTNIALAEVDESEGASFFAPSDGCLIVFDGTDLLVRFDGVVGSTVLATKGS